MILTLLCSANVVERRLVFQTVKPFLPTVTKFSQRYPALLLLVLLSLIFIKRHKIIINTLYKIHFANQNYYAYSTWKYKWSDNISNFLLDTKWKSEYKFTIRYIEILLF